MTGGPSPQKKRTSSNDEEDIPLLEENNNDDTTTPPALSGLLTIRCNISATSTVYAVTFFTCMVIMELILEGTQNAFTDFLGLPYAVTLFQFISCFCLPVVLTQGQTLHKLPSTTKETTPYVALSLVTFGSLCFKSMSVRYVSFPTKVIFKSTKLIPTMVLSTLIQNGERYGRKDYLAATLLCAGAAGYSFGEAKTNDDKEDSWLGLMLLAISVFCDAFTPNIQQRFMAPPISRPPVPPSSTTSSNNNTTKSRFDVCSLVLPQGGGGLGLGASTLMSNTNFVGCIGVLLFMTVTHHIHDAIGVALVRPYLLVNLVLIGISLSTAVFAHIRLIKESGAVVAVGVATLREVATVILSYVVYPKVFSLLHAVSALLVLGGILLTMSCSNQPTVPSASISNNNRRTTTTTTTTIEVGPSTSR
jgi:drug/metabolite transporter (DMT)-like permease